MMAIFLTLSFVSAAVMVPAFQQNRQSRLLTLPQRSVEHLLRGCVLSVGLK
jgi:hypothetical protein